MSNELNHGDSLKLSFSEQRFKLLSSDNPSEVFFTDKDKKKIKKIINYYPDKQAALMPVLWLAQEKFGWLSKEVLALVSNELEIFFADVVGVASFYTMYFKRPVGKKHLAVCTNLSCKLVGAYNLYNYLRDRYGLENGCMTKDGKVSLEEAECLGSCGTAPVIQISNGKYLEKVSLDKLKKFLDSEIK